MSAKHYENFPVASLLLPRRLRRPVLAVYAFARTADDIADEGEADDAERLAGLAALRTELDRIAAGQTPQTALMQRLQQDAVAPFGLPLTHAYDLLSAFEQDVICKRYSHFAELIDYARRSANPVGRMLLYFYGENDPKSIARSDGICTALQLINFWQDVALDWQKGRVYLPQEDLARFRVSEADIGAGRHSPEFQRLMAHQCRRAFNMLRAGAPLGNTLRGRIGLEVRMIVSGGLFILQKLEQNRYDVFRRRPVLNRRDRLSMLQRALLKK